MSDGADVTGPDASAPAAAGVTPPSPGRLLREARERQGLHIAALAASIKVTPKKLEALEADRYQDLPDATFTRALAQTVCRALKIDPAPVLKLLPPPAGYRLEQLGEGLNTPYRDRQLLLVQRDWGALAKRPALWITVFILVVAIAIFFLPKGLFSGSTGQARSGPDVTGDVASARTGSPGPANLARPGDDAIAVPTFVAAPGVSASEAGEGAATVANSAATGPATSTARTAEAASSADAVLPAGMLQVQASAATWLEVRDADGRPLIARLLRPGEAIGINGTPPLRVQIGNAADTRVTFRGQPTELAAFTRDNVARLELR